MGSRACVLIAAGLVLASCANKERRQKPTRAPAAEPAAEAAEAAEAPCKLDANPSRYPAAERVIAIGDVHGDLNATRAALRAGGAIDDADRWIGGKLVVVQTGDILDRGDDEQAIIDLFESLRKQAKAAGGALHVVNGNHELMNVAGDLRYVTAGGFADFRDVKGLDLSGLDDIAEDKRARIAAFKPGGKYARILARYNTVVMVGDTVFVHGGVIPRFAEYGIERLNAEIRCWVKGASPMPKHLEDPNGPTWSRHFSMSPERCDLLVKSLDALGAKRMVVGHTVQRMRGANSACGGRVWRVDVGLAEHYGGPIQVLEIRGTTVRVINGKR